MAMYLLVVLDAFVPVALQMMLFVRHFPSRGQRSLFLQLPLSVVGYFTFIQYLPVVVFDYVGHVSCAAVAYFKGTGSR